jgi:hypothetical protein
MATPKKTGDTFYCVCRHCGGQRSITVGMRFGEKELFAENDCKCPKPAALFRAVACDQCAEIGKHWLGCAFIGLPSIPTDEPAETP